ncbi:glycosyltransferase family 2 protein [Sphingobacterium bovistauri]|uniref:Glycosyltransferase n=1 Tax=Sphingobacterium bovistauri TaxID=2781959 RepID=A0ABS7Z2A7_9SPHI|nr:glycosyltransferase [Sphingobacterium bovistauri]MCA5004113.1 glycosyltransferase [Sphingobacterium bovistauri]
MIDRPLFSVLIAHFNNARYFKEAYDSVLAQSYSNFEIIVVDDYSDESEFDIVKQLVANDHRVRLYRNAVNKGVGFTKRYLANLVKGEIFGFLDPDDTLTADAIESVVSIHLKYLDVGLVYSNFYFCDSYLAIICEHKAMQVVSLKEMSYFNFKGEISHFATFKKLIYDKTSGIDIKLRIAEDKDIYMKMCEVAPVKHLDIPLYFYRVHSGGISTNDNSRKAVFWHWVAIIKSAERNNINIEDMFCEYFISREEHISKLDMVRGSRLLKLISKIGFIKWFKNL